MITQALKDRVEPIREDELIPWKRDLVGDIFVIDSSKYYNEYTPFMQIYTGGSGFGSQIGKIGSKIFCKELHTELNECITRDSVIGILPYSKIFEYFESPYEMSTTLRNMLKHIRQNEDSTYFAPDNWTDLVKHYFVFLQEVAEGKHSLTLESNEELRGLYWRMSTDDEATYNLFSSALKETDFDKHTEKEAMPSILLPLFYGSYAYTDDDRLGVSQTKYMLQEGNAQVELINSIKSKLSAPIHTHTDLELATQLTREEMSLIMSVRNNRFASTFFTYGVSLLDLEEGETVKTTLGKVLGSGVTIQEFTEFVLKGRTLLNKTLDADAAADLIRAYLKDSARLRLRTLIPVKEMVLFTNLDAIRKKEYPDNRSDGLFYSDPLDIESYPITGNYYPILIRLMEIATDEGTPKDERAFIKSAVSGVLDSVSKKPQTFSFTVSGQAREFLDTVQNYLKLEDKYTKVTLERIEEQLHKLLARDVPLLTEGSSSIVTMHDILNKDFEEKELLN